MEPQIKRLRDDTSELQKEIDNEKAKAESIEKVQLGCSLILK